MVERKYFGETQNGDIVSKFLLENKSGMQVEVSDLGALVLAISIIDKDGIQRDVALGFEKVEDYFDTETGMGAYVGRNANRIKGACVNIEGVDYKLDANEGNNNLHSGFNRSHCQMYYSEKGADDSGEYVEFHRVSPHLEQGFPGDLEQTIRYTLTKNNELMIDYVMSSDKTTIVNPTNHTYFNLDGHSSGTILEHELEIYSDSFLDIDKEMIPTGDIIGVSGTPMDFRKKKKIGLDIDSEYLPLRTANGYDHNYIFKNDRILKKVAKLYSSESGISMTVLSDLCGLQIYTGNFLNGQAGKDGSTYGKHSGICLETQFYPNSCNDKRFPSPLLEAGTKFVSRTVYKFELQ